MTDVLQSIYYDPKHPGGFASVKKLAEASGLSQREVKTWLKAQDTYTLHTMARLNYPTRGYVVHDIDEQWQADLVDVSFMAQNNKDYHFILTVIDLFSRYGWARPLKTKHGREVADAFLDIFLEGRIPKRIQTDQGKEFENRWVRQLFQHYGVELFSIKSAVKAACVERFNRTIKTRMWKYFTARFTSNWVPILPDLIYAYNHSVHRIIKRRPVDVGPDDVDAMREERQQRKKPTRGKTDIHLGDKVRISKVKSVFAKGYLPSWTEEIFTVAEINDKFTPRMYKLKDYHGHVIDGSFYRQEIEPVIKDDDVYLIERVIRRRRRDGEVWALVKWLGYPSSMNSWVRESDLSELV